MAAHSRWDEIKARRPMTAEMRETYDRAERAHQIGRRVRELREAAGLTQTELARRMRTSQSMVARLEMGGVDPKLDTVERVSAALDADLVVDLRPRAV